jgi:hypothetical protein
MNKLSQAAAEFCTVRTADPYWNESAWFSLSVPERGIHGFFYYFFRPNMNLLVGGPAVWDGTGSQMWNCLYYDWRTFQAMPEGARKFDFTAPNSLSVETLEAARRYRLRYDNNGLNLDLEWEAISEPHDFTGMEELATGAVGKRLHIEQCGRLRGRLHLRGERVSVDSYSLRDTSFGVRHFGQVVKGSYFWGIASPETAFHVLTLGDGPEQKVAGGFLIQDGRMETIIGGMRKVIEDGPLTPASFALDIEDKADRRASLIARTKTDFIFTGYPDNPTTWSMLEIEHNGKTYWGDIQEFRPLEVFRHQQRNGLLSAENVP